ncbi:hypothetical protein KOR42_47930 [Thalassoglobus neptunius]|uniref:Uncharacterized protein n=1 Tax=Thalassoglobus neptunius TaxID=1938619 RepID=A0A5C5VT59_9PLAN|nr:hypothetical protein KOR42_47930 [Thalassoglobus neptunius]
MIVCESRFRQGKDCPKPVFGTMIIWEANWFRCFLSIPRNGVVDNSRDTYKQKS